MLPKGHNEITQKVVLELIYPAILGAILYEFLNSITHLIQGKQIFTTIVVIKLILLIISIGFYVCDYFYIMFTKSYLWWFFLFDILFILLLYATVVAINVDESDSLPHNKSILIFYIAFLFVYRIWDKRELDDAKKHKRLVAAEYFQSVVRWETLSLYIVGSFFLISLGSLIWDIHYWISIVSIPILFGVTAWFAFLVNKRRVLGV